MYFKIIEENSVDHDQLASRKSADLGQHVHRPRISGFSKGKCFDALCPVNIYQSCLDHVLFFWVEPVLSSV